MNGRPSPRISAGIGLIGFARKTPKSSDLDPLSALERLGHLVENQVYDLFGALLGHFGPFRQPLDKF